jgi:hypothetical protein
MPARHLVPELREPRKPRVKIQLSVIVRICYEPKVVRSGQRSYFAMSDGTL